MKLPLHIWMNFPSHHQSGLFSALRNAGVDLRVTYYESISVDRLSQGWQKENLQPWEHEVQGSATAALQRLHTLRDSVHIIPGYGSPLLRALVSAASHSGIRWCHWSEASHPGPRWIASFPRKRQFARAVNEHALGAFAQGDMARRDFMRWGINPEKISHLFYAAPPPSAMQPHPEISAFARGRLTFLFLGQLNHRKAIDIQIRAFSRLAPECACLVFIGSGDPGVYIRDVAVKKLTDRVHFFPPVPSSDVAKTLRAADVVLLPSRFDGWGVVANEAASLGKALILSSACGAAWHLVEPGVNGFVVAPGSVDSLHAALSTYVNGGRSLAARHGVESQRISERFTCEVSAQRLIQSIQSWTAGDRSSVS